jgi:hypothetical protein
MAFLGLRSGSTSPDASVVAGPLSPQHFHPPSPRELRAQVVHRLQIGLLGLAGMLLLVGLANIIMDRARVNDGVAAEAAAAASATTATVAPTTAPESPGSDPLADMGVVPDLPAENAAPAAPDRPAPPLGR